MNIETLLNNLLEVIYKNPEHVKIEYSYNDGDESLLINGEEQLRKFDDSRIKSIIKNYKENLDLLDDCVFVEALESLEDRIDFQQMDELLNQEKFTQAEANLVDDLINIVNKSIKEKLNQKINELEDIFTRF